jgi:hemoglobin
VGELRPKETRVDYDLFVLDPSALDAASAASSESPAQGPSALFERLGSREGIYRLMSASIDSLHGNEQLNRQNPRLAQVKGRTDPLVFKQRVTDFICGITGGPCKYEGRSMRDSHADLGISEGDWRVFVDDFIRVMDDFRIPKLDQHELLMLMDRSKADILAPASTARY